MKFSEYVDGITRSANTIFEGLAVTFSHLFREPVTIQYPDRTCRPVKDMLPDRYRGFLEVQMDVCGACRRCERICPVECIQVETQKNPETKKLNMVRFDIDMAKCMYCGLCTDVCPTECIIMTKSYDFSTTDREDFIHHFGNLGPEETAEKQAEWDKYEAERKAAKAKALAAAKAKKEAAAKAKAEKEQAEQGQNDHSQPKD